MREETPGMLGTCFVVMGFGKKTDFETGRTLDLDKTYKNIIKPAAEAARLKCVRADEIVHSGMIDLPMYEQLLTADVVIADLSTSNKNAFYELGVRHALRPYTTIVIAEDGIKVFPFDINHVVVRQYRHMGEDIGYTEVMRFREELTAAITKILATEPRQNDSPIYTIIKNLAPPLRGEEKKEATTTRAMRGAPPAPEVAPPVIEPGPPPQGGSGSPDMPAPAPEASVMTYRSCMEKVDEAETRGDFLTAKTLLGQVRANFKADNPNRAEDPSLIQRLAFATYKSEHPSPIQAFGEASNILHVLNPETSNDPETLGFWGAINKRFWKETNERPYLDRAVRAYGRGFYLRNDYYNGINYAHQLNVRGMNASTRAEAIADFVEAERIRKEVLLIAEPLLTHDLSDENKYWIRATMAEAYVGLGDEEKGRHQLQEAEWFSPSEWMKETTDKRLAALRGYLDQSPLKFVNTE